MFLNSMDIDIWIADFMIKLPLKQLPWSGDQRCPFYRTDRWSVSPMTYFWETQRGRIYIHLPTLHSMGPSKKINQISNRNRTSMIWMYLDQVAKQLGICTCWDPGWSEIRSNLWKPIDDNFLDMMGRTSWVLPISMSRWCFLEVKQILLEKDRCYPRSLQLKCIRVNLTNLTAYQTTTPFSVDIAGVSEFQFFHKFHTHINYHKLS